MIASEKRSPESSGDDDSGFPAVFQPPANQRATGMKHTGKSRTPALDCGPRVRRIILASASPRRRRLLEQAGISAAVTPADVDESPRPGELPAETAVRLACEKAAAVAPGFPNAVVLGADTLVVLDGEPLGKPKDLEQARKMLTRLSGRTHRVLTGVCLLRLEPFRRQTWITCSEVQFHRLTPADIEDYLRRVHVLDKAGAYAIQEHGGRLVDHVHGPVSNVIGLPIEEIRRRLESF